MINANKVINKENEYKKILNIESTKKRAKYLEFSTDINEMENLCALISFIIDSSMFNDSELINIFKNKFSLDSFKKNLDMQIESIMKEYQNLRDVDFIKLYTEENITPYYESKFTINKSREMSFLPLDLRLYVYNCLLQKEIDIFTSLNYLDRISVTLAKMGHKNLASIACAYNWVLKWGDSGSTNRNDIFKRQLHFIRQAEGFRKDILSKNDLDGSGYIDECLNCLSQFSNLEIINDKIMANKLLPLVKHYYRNIPQIDAYINDICEYMKTGNKEKIKYIQDERKNYNAYYKVYNLGEKEIRCEDRIIECDVENSVKIDNINEIMNGLELSDAVDQYNLGIQLHKEGKYKEAVKWIEKAANQGNDKAQHSLGYFYEIGEGIEQSYKEAFKCYTKAANQGNINSQYNLAQLYYTGKGVKINHEKAAKWTEKAAKQGDIEAQYNLGVFYERGKGLEQNYKKAFKCYMKAAEKRHMNAQYNLGIFYEYGKGVNINYEKAVEWYGKAAEQGHIEAQYNLGVCYYNGKGTNKNYKKAVEWYEKAANKGYIDAQYNLWVCYKNGEGVPKDYEKAVKWIEKAAKQGDSEAQYNLGICYYKGIGIEKNYEEARRWIERASSNGFRNVNYEVNVLFNEF